MIVMPCMWLGSQRTLWGRLITVGKRQMDEEMALAKLPSCEQDLQKLLEMIEKFHSDESSSTAQCIVHQTKACMRTLDIIEACKKTEKSDAQTTLKSLQEKIEFVQNEMKTFAPMGHLCTFLKSSWTSKDVGFPNADDFEFNVMKVLNQCLIQGRQGANSLVRRGLFQFILPRMIHVDPIHACRQQQLRFAFEVRMLHGSHTTNHHSIG